MKRKEALSPVMSNRISRKNAIPLVEVLKEMLVEGKAGNTHNSYRIFSAWDKVSGAASYTVKRFFRDGNLYITLSSSVICNQLSMQKDALLKKLNADLAADELYIGDASEAPVKQLILK